MAVIRSLSRESTTEGLQGFLTPPISPAECRGEDESWVRCSFKGWKGAGADARSFPSAVASGTKASIDMVIRGGVVQVVG
jgi:hypothetical protein